VPLLVHALIIKAMLKKMVLMSFQYSMGHDILKILEAVVEVLVLGKHPRTHSAQM
jgi:hypothetical protein